MYKNILIPTDGSKLAEKAVQHGIALSKTLGARSHRTDGLVALPYSYDQPTDD